MKYGVFISYSHEDAKFVGPIVKLITAMREDLVFQDTNDLKAGKKWEPQLQGALEEAELVIVFWCRHSAHSDYVRLEYEKAITSNKDILPVLLDDCALDEHLSAYQWIDFNGTISHSKNSNKLRSRILSFIGITTALAIIFLLCVMVAESPDMLPPNSSLPSFDSTRVAVRDSVGIAMSKDSNKKHHDYDPSEYRKIRKSSIKKHIRGKKYTYDSIENIIVPFDPTNSVIEYDSFSHQYTYDPKGNLIIRDSHGKLNYRDSNQNSFTYDNLGRVVSVNHEVKTPPPETSNLLWYMISGSILVTFIAFIIVRYLKTERRKAEFAATEVVKKLDEKIPREAV